MGRRLGQIAMAGSGLEDLAYDGLFQLLDQLSSSPTGVSQHFFPSFLPLLEAHWNSNTLLLLLRAVDNFKNLDVTPFAKKLKNKVITNPANLEVIGTVLAHDIPKVDSPFWTLVSFLLLFLPKFLITLVFHLLFMVVVEFFDTQLLKNAQGLSVADKQAFVTGVWKIVSGTLGSKKKDTQLITLFTWFWDFVRLTFITYCFKYFICVFIIILMQSEAVHLSLLIDSLFLVLRRQQNDDNEEFAAATLKIKEAAIKDPARKGAAVLCYYPELAQDLSAKDVTDITAQLATHFYNQTLNPLRIGQALAHIARDILVGDVFSSISIDFMSLLYLTLLKFQRWGIGSCHPKIPVFPWILCPQPQPLFQEGKR